MKGRRRFPGPMMAVALLTFGCETASEEKVQPVRANAFVAAARHAFGEPREAPAEYSLCLSPRFKAPGNPEIDPEIRRALEEDGWDFYDEELPTGPGSVLLSFSRPVRSGDRVLLRVRFDANLGSSAGRDVNASFSEWEYWVSCLGEDCSVESGSSETHGHGPSGAADE